MKKYRIKEDQNGFSIEIEVTEIKGCLRWKKEVKYWCGTNVFGDKPFVNRYFYDFFKPSPHFETIEEAKEQIKKWNTPIKYHEVN